ncbi:NADPH oxidoreductase A [Gracilariopsis chorda]|uniref:NADPH oxidoreductase A n=1 Tax=Gracilariopsis chorda TaxID=448386 RepID=A0A2V3IS33_9FLOR|nr:NADPH oxidoreductase A [Gracilariopsis chorda]|eukprot:PXF44922.1 NADPH oxidoreductase A [Gracilariopsis chorda]
MLALLLALALLAFAFRKLLSRSKSNSSESVQRPPSIRDKISREAFEHTVQHPHPRRVLLLYATEYGFAQQVASYIAQHLSQQQHLAPRVVNVLHYPLLNFARETVLLFICSTTGDGVPPTEASDFRDALDSNQISLPPSLNVAILALGDRAYPHFCRAGAIFEHLFKPASTLHPITNINQQDWTSIQLWLNSIAPKVKSVAPSPLSDYLPAAIEKYANSYQSPTRYSRNNPYMATITARNSLTTALPKSADRKKVIRVQLAIEPQHLQYTVGDAVAIIPTNNPSHVTRLLLAMAVNGHELVTIPHVTHALSFETALTNHLDICTIQPSLIYELAKRSSNASQLSLAHNILGSPLSTSVLTPFGQTYVRQRHVFDLLSDFVSVSVSPQTLVQYLRPLHARYYSISSTPLTRPRAIAITVDVLRYTSLNIEREGVASSFLNNRCPLNETKVPIFISSNPNFRLPKDLTNDIIMIGPGTGIAPFVAFIEQRIAQNASGTNCLFFGCRHKAHDFLYEAQLRQYEAQRQLKLFTAFSRDGASKVYVQHRMRENAQLLWEMMEGGAHVYVCGDGRRMSGDVHEALRDIVQRCAAFTRDESEAYLQMLTDQKRYQRDVWVT